MIKETNSKFILKYITNSENNNKIKFEGINQYSLDLHNYEKNTFKLRNINKYDDVAIVIFTSGTTGKPKGSLLTHNNIINYCFYSQTDNGKEIFTDQYEVAIASAKFTFDMSICEIFYSIIRNKMVVICDDNEYNDPELIAKNIMKYGVDYVFITPSRIEKYVENETYSKSIRNVKFILLGGESVNVKMIENISKHTSAVIYNVYGPTETTITCTLSEMARSSKINEKLLEAVTIGKPICNSKIYILDKYLKPVPIGVEGEIYVGGYGVSKGYLNREELTRERYIPCPFHREDQCHQVMYKTGDLGKWTEDGEIICLGRIDFQVKIHGQRIELEEIESCIKEMDEIEHVTVIDKENQHGENELRKIPLTANGKLDRRALPEVVDITDIINDNYVAPETEIEKCICEIFSKTLNMDVCQIGRRSDFYELGGDSLNVIKIIAEIKKKLNVQLNIKDVMKHSLISSLSLLINEKLMRQGKIMESCRIPRYGQLEYPATTVLSAMTYDAQNMSLKDLNVFSNNMMQCYKLPETIDIEKLKQSFVEIVERHEVLKTVFFEKEVHGEKKIYGRIRKNEKLKIETYTVENFFDFIRPFDITKDLLIRIGLVENKVLLIDMDHKIADGYSFGVILNDLYKFYNDEPLEELPFQYSDYAIRYDEQLNSEKSLKQIEYYKRMFDAPFDSLNIDDKPSTSGVEQEKPYNSILLDTDSEIYDRINDISRRNGVSKTAIFLIIYSLVMSVYSGQDNIFTALITSSRLNASTENLVGLFARYLPILVKMEEEEEEEEDVCLIDLINHFMNVLLTLFNYNIPFSTISEKLNLPHCNSWFKFDPYQMMNNDDLTFGKTIDYEEIYNVFQRRDLMHCDKNKIYDPFRNTLELLSNENTPDFIFIVAENKDHYKINFLYNKYKYEDELIRNIINHMLNIIKNEDNFKNDIPSNAIKTIKYNIQEQIKQEKYEKNDTTKIEKKYKKMGKKIKKFFNLFKLKNIKKQEKHF
eukprot:jgi/Orpsp1_1/1183781/evm.model.c7180000086707.1